MMKWIGDNLGNLQPTAEEEGTTVSEAKHGFNQQTQDPSLKFFACAFPRRMNAVSKDLPRKFHPASAPLAHLHPDA